MFSILDVTGSSFILHYLHTDPDFKDSSKSAGGTFQCF